MISTIITLQSWNGEGDVTSYNYMKEGIDFKRLRTYNLHDGSKME